MENIPLRRISETQREPAISGSFVIRDVQDLLDGKDMVQELHRHDFFFILAIEKGTGNHEIDFVAHEISDHHIFFMRPGQVHQLTLKAGSIGYLIQFKRDFYFPNDKPSDDLLRVMSYRNLCQLDEKGFKKVYDLLGYIFNEFTAKQQGYHEVIKSNLKIFFIELLRRRQNPERNTNDVSTYTQERFDEFQELLEAHVTDQKQVAYYADKLNLSHYQLNAITKAMLGKTSSEVIDEHIILEAKRFLLATTNQVTQIAYQLGYEDVSYFIRFFKKHTGHSPEAFRNNFR